MISTRRVFLKNGSLALVSLGFAPAFVARAAAEAAPARKILVAIFQRGAVDGLNMVVPFGERAYYAAAAVDRDRRGPATSATARTRSRRLLRPAPAHGVARSRSSRAAAGDRPRLRLARRHALALRRAGLHGERHAGREEHAGRLAESLPARAGAPRTPARSAPSRSRRSCRARCRARRRRWRSDSSASSASARGNRPT